MHSHAPHFEYHEHDNDGYQHDGHHSTGRIFFAFLLSLAFSITEFIGGFLTGSVAITSDSVHSFGDAISTGISCLFEYLDHRHHHSHRRYSLIGAAITTIVLFFASAILIYEAIERITSPTEVDSGGMIFFAILGVVFNFLAAFVTRHGHGLNQKSVNLHKLEDCLAWLAVLLGAIVMRLTGIHLIDPILSIGVAIFILYYVVQNTHALLAAFRQPPK